MLLPFSSLPSVFPFAARTCTGRSVVRHEDDHCIFEQAPFIKLVEHQAVVLVDVFDHSVEACCLGAKPEVGESLCVFGWRNERTMRSIGGDVCKKWFAAVLHVLDPADACVEEQVRAIPFRFDERPVVPDDRIEVLVSGGVRATTVVSLADTAGSVNEGFIETTVVRLILFLVTEMPLAKDAGRVADALQQLWKRHSIERHAFTFQDRVSNAVSHRMPSRHQSRTRWRARRSNEESREPHALVIHAIEIRSLKPGMSVFPNLAVALVIGHHHDDVWFRAGDCVAMSVTQIRKK